MIVIDWGTTNLRAYLCREDGSIRTRFQRDRGIKTLIPTDYPAELSAVVESLRPEKRETVYISGMAGSRGGWRETPYANCPVGMSDLADKVLPLPESFSGYFIGGVRTEAIDGTTDVMRGEEIQIFGALQQLGKDDAVFCLPGTHSKWARTRNGQITDFSTYMTGDLFQALASTILACAPVPQIDPQVFTAGLDAVEQTSGGILHQLFTVRTRVLDGVLDTDQVPAFVSGLLIGHELQQAGSLLKEDEVVVVIGVDYLSDLYCRALNYHSIRSIQLGSDVSTCTGIAALRRMMQEKL